MNFFAAAVPITDKDRRLLPLHFASDPGPDFTWWLDDEDTKIAANATLNLQQKLELLSKYVDLVKISLKKPKYATLNGQCTELTNGVVGKTSSSSSDTTATTTYGSQDDIGGDSNRSSRLNHQQRTAMNFIDNRLNWRGSTGNLPNGGGQKSATAASYLGVTRATWSKLTKSLKKRLKSKTRSTKQEEKSNFYDVKMLNNNNFNSKTIQKSSFSSSNCPVNLNEIRDSNLITGAKLHTDAHHQFMDEMINNYLKAARQRFENDKEQKTTNQGVGGNVRAPRRERLSRSFSASSVLVKCMNGNCDGKGTHQTNFLCDLCFKTQKQLMESFTTANNQQQQQQQYYAAAAAGATVSLPGRASSVPSHAKTLPSYRTTTTNVARSTFYNGDCSIAYNNASCVAAESTTPTSNGCFPVARSTFYTADDDGRYLGAVSSSTSSSPSVTVVKPVMQQNLNGTSFADSPNGLRKVYRSIETRYGVNSITTPTGVTHYYPMPPEEEGCSDNNNQQLFSCCNSWCSGYRAGFTTLCVQCAKAAAKKNDGFV